MVNMASEENQLLSKQAEVRRAGGIARLSVWNLAVAGILLFAVRLYFESSSLAEFIEDPFRFFIILIYLPFSASIALYSYVMFVTKLRKLSDARDELLNKLLRDLRVK